jgi:hypothetical protein
VLSADQPEGQNMKLKHALLCVSLVSVVMILSPSCVSNSGSVKLPTQPRTTTLKAKVIAAADSIRLQVQSFRHKNYERPVYVSVYTQSEYAAIVGNQTSTISQSQKALYNRILKLEGLLRPTQDYYSSYDSAIAGGTDGFYVPGTDSLYVILADTATGLGLQDSLTLFHEFVHALQDQYFNLVAIDTLSSTSDQYYASDYVIEGEAELLMDYYWFKLVNGSYPSTATPVVSFLNQEQIGTEQYLDSLHQAGVPMLTNMPMQWEYFSYGPKFINAIAGMNWSIIDNTIFPALPLRMLEILHPSEYSSSNEYWLDVTNLETAIVDSGVIQDEDELGELLSDVMFREWDFSSYSTIPTGMMADNVIVFRDLHVDSLRMVWNTYWTDSSAGASFFANYAALVNKKRGIQLPPAVDSGAIAFVKDTVNNIYIEQGGNYVFTIENYSKSSLNNLIANCRTVNPNLLSSLAKARAGTSRTYPRINKHKLPVRQLLPFPPKFGAGAFRQH